MNGRKKAIHPALLDLVEAFFGAGGCLLKRAAVMAIGYRYGLVYGLMLFN